MAAAVAERVVLGTVPLRLAGERERMAVLDEFLAGGGRWIDTAPFYGDVERSVGRFLESCGADASVATKAGHFADPRAYRSRAAVAEAIDRSVERLGRPPAVLSLHEADWAVWWAAARPGAVLAQGPLPGGVPPAWEALVDKCREHGSEPAVTGNNAGPLRAAAQRLGCTRLLVAKQYDLIWRSAEALLDWGAAAGVMVWCGSPFHQGALLDLPRLRAEFAARGDDEAVRAADALEHLLRADHAATPSTALAFVLSDERVEAVAVGLATRSEVRQALAAARRPLDPGLLAGLRRLGIRRPPRPGVIREDHQGGAS
jgi:aryl-alcohol dehydrogenase-like predicted oxidoreductase